MDLFQGLQRVRGRDFTKECSAARLKGEILIQRRLAGGILVVPVEEFSDHKSLQRPLACAFEEKLSRALGIAKDRKYVTMLAVDVERADTRGYLGGGRQDARLPAEDRPPVPVRSEDSGRGPGRGVLCQADREGRRLKRLDLP
jgi:hypothetical protein